MKAFQNLKIKSKLTLAFVLLIVVAALIGAVGLIGMQMIEQEDTELFEENTLPIGYLAELNDIVASQRISLLQVALFTGNDEAEVAAEREYLAGKEKEFEKMLADYKASITTDEEMASYNELNSRYTGAFAQAKRDVLDASAAGDTADILATVKVAYEKGSDVSDVIDDAVELNRSEAQAKVAANTALARSSTIVLIIVLAIGVAIAIAFIFIISNAIAKPMERIMVVTRQVGDTGNLHFTEDMMSGIKSDAAYRDETGQTSMYFAAMMDSLVAKTKVLEQVADGDLSVTVEKDGEQDTLGNALDKMLDSLNGMFGEINGATDQVSSGSGQIATGAQSLAQATTEQAATVEELLASVGDVAEKTRANAQRAEQAATLAGSIKQSAEQGTDQMNRMTQAVEEINAASQSISAVIKVIDDIAFQTNILALNAAVEAARAGEHGKGFAVVADEVRNLAGKSAEAAKDTGKLIADTVEKAELGAQIATETSTSLETIVEGINESTRVVSEIASSSDEQRLAIDEIDKGIEQVSVVVQQNSATAEESAAAAEEMSSQAVMLKGMVARFKLRQGEMPMVSVARSGAPAPAPALPVASGGDVIF